MVSNLRLNPEVVAKIKIDLFGHYCWWCGQCLPEKELTIEHLLPLSRGGSNSNENLQLACFPCNKLRENSLYPPRWKKGICF
jgi:5-methylcytosine-specific restriction endonuclease McrA